MMVFLLIVAFAIGFFTSVGVFFFVERILHRSSSIKRTIMAAIFSVMNASFLCLAGMNRVSNIFINGLLLIILIIQFLLLYKGNFVFVFLGSALFVFHFLCARACATSIISLVFGVSLKVVVRDAVFSVWSLLLTAFILLIILLAYLMSPFAKFFDSIYETPIQTIMICTVEAVLLAFQLISALSYNVKVFDMWFTVFHLSSAMLSIAAHFVLAYHLIMYSHWIMEDFKTDILSKRISRQIIHYESYEKHIDGFRDFRAEYDKLVGDMRHNILIGNTSEAQQLLQKADINVQNIISGHAQYSNNMLVDSVLWDTACAAKKQSIEFEASVSLPSWLGLSEIELCCLFSNLCSNAIEGAATAPDKKEIIIKGFGDDKWFTIFTENSYSGITKYQNGSLITTKPDGELHGMGVKSITDILQAHKGFCEIEHDKKAFKVTAHIPK